MILKDFIKTYSSDSYQGPSEYIFECAYDMDEGFILPDGFRLNNSISRIPLFIIATNRDEKAIVRFDDGQLSLSIYDHEVSMDAAVSLNTKYFQQKFGRYSLNRFCKFVEKTDMMGIMDAISAELFSIEHSNETCMKKDIYTKDLKALLSLFMNTSISVDTLRDGFIKEAYPLLKEIEKYVVTVQNLNLVKIAEVYYTKTDETYYVLNKQFEDYENYVGNCKEETIAKLLKDGWNRFGHLTRWDDVSVEVFSKDNAIIAIWDDGVILTG